MLIPGVIHYNRHYLICFVVTLPYLNISTVLDTLTGSSLVPRLSPCLGTRLEEEGALLTEQCSSENSLWVSVFTLQVACSAFGLQLDVHWWIAIIVPLMIVCCWIQNWEDFASFSMIGNLCIVFSLVVTVGEEIHRLVSNDPADMAAIKNNATNVTVNYWPETALGLALYFGSVVYAFEGIGVVSIAHHNITYSVKISRGKTFHKFQGFVAIRESFFCEIWGRGVLRWHHAPASNLQSFLCWFAKFFSRESFLLYGSCSAHIQVSMYFRERGRLFPRPQTPSLPPEFGLSTQIWWEGLGTRLGNPSLPFQSLSYSFWFCLQSWEAKSGMDKLGSKLFTWIVRFTCMWVFLSFMLMIPLLPPSSLLFPPPSSSFLLFPPSSSFLLLPPPQTSTGFATWEQNEETPKCHSYGLLCHGCYNSTVR